MQVKSFILVKRVQIETYSSMFHLIAEWQKLLAINCYIIYVTKIGMEKINSQCRIGMFHMLLY